MKGRFQKYMSEESYPKSVFCIIATEFCERFSFCGLRTILSLYLRDELFLKEDTATIMYHIFIMICYIVPIAGATLADSYLGRYKTILYFSIIYLCGNILMCVAAIPSLDLSPLLYTSVGLCLIAIGTGGIKPCVAAFGADQFHLPRQTMMLQRFSSIFYFTINLGGFVGMILTPILRKHFTCFGEDTCYALGFGFPAVLMFIALILFVSGKPLYRLKIPRDNVVLNFVSCAIYARIQKWKRRKEPPKSHWLDYAADKYPSKLIQDMKNIFSVLLLFTPLPIYWSLFDQQGSRWTFQASRMETTIMGTQIVPDQMQVVNPGMVLILIPIYDRLIFPCLNRINILGNPLHRMAIGGLTAGMAFLAAGLVELALQRTYPVQPGKNQSSLYFINTLSCNLVIYSPFDTPKILEAGKILASKNFPAHVQQVYNITIEVPPTCEFTEFDSHLFELQVEAVEKQVHTVLIATSKENKITIHVTEAVDFEKSMTGKPKIRVAYIQTSSSYHNVTITLRSQSGMSDTYFTADDLPNDLSLSAYMELPVGSYDYFVDSNEELVLGPQTISLALGGVYTLAIRERAGNIEFAYLFVLSPPNSLNILWLLPQYFLISVAEIMFGIAGLEFSLTQAPKSLKTITLAAWYLSVAMGNLIVIVIAKYKFFADQADEFFFFAVLVVADMVVFILMAENYKFVSMEADSSASVMKEKKHINSLKYKKGKRKIMSSNDLNK